MQVQPSWAKNLSVTAAHYELQFNLQSRVYVQHYDSKTGQDKYSTSDETNQTFQTFTSGVSYTTQLLVLSLTRVVGRLTSMKACLIKIRTPPSDDVPSTEAV